MVVLSTNFFCSGNLGFEISNLKSQISAFWRAEIDMRKPMAMTNFPDGREHGVSNTGEARLSLLVSIAPGIK
jgi:hypothetical protein